MSAHALAGLLVSASLVAGSLQPQAAPTNGRRLTLAVLPCTNIESTFEKFHPLLTFLEAQTGGDFALVAPLDVTDLEARAAHGQVDFVLQDPHTYLQLSHLLDPSFLLQVRALDGTTSQSAVVVARRDSGFRSLADLRGRTVMFGPRTSSTKWIAATELFARAGVSVLKDLAWQNGGCCEDIAFAVALKAVDAGVVCDHFLGSHDRKQKTLGVDVRALVVLARTDPVPTRVFAAVKGVPPDVTAKVSRALLRLDARNRDHAAILERAEVSGFASVSPAEYSAALRRAGGAGAR